MPPTARPAASPIDAMPLTDLDLAHESRITEDENLRFSMPVSVLGRLRKRNRGGMAFKIGDQEVSHLRGQGIELVNIGEAGRVKQDEIGHWICSVCGAAKSPYAVPAEIARFLKIHKERVRQGRCPAGPVVQADVDMLQFHSTWPTRPRGSTSARRLRTAATRLLDMGPDDLQLLLVHKPDDKLDLLIYDPMPGGSGLLEQMLARWQELITTAKELAGRLRPGLRDGLLRLPEDLPQPVSPSTTEPPRGLELLVELDQSPEAIETSCRCSRRSAPAGGRPRTRPRPGSLRFLLDHQFPAGAAASGSRLAGLPTEPDWLHEASKVAVYLDGMSRGLHGDPKSPARTRSSGRPSNSTATR